MMDSTGLELDSLRQSLAEAESHGEKLQQELDDIKRILQDPVAVHINMLRGTIARISMANCAHSHGVNFNELEACQAALVDALVEKEMLRIALKPFADADVGPREARMVGLDVEDFARARDAFNADKGKEE